MKYRIKKTTIVEASSKEEALKKVTAAIDKNAAWRVKAKQIIAQIKKAVPQLSGGTFLHRSNSVDMPEINGVRLSVTNRLIEVDLNEEEKNDDNPTFKLSEVADAVKEIKDYFKNKADEEASKKAKQKEWEAKTTAKQFSPEIEKALVAAGFNINKASQYSEAEAEKYVHTDLWVTITKDDDGKRWDIYLGDENDQVGRESYIPIGDIKSAIKTANAKAAEYLKGMIKSINTSISKLK